MSCGPVYHACLPKNNLKVAVNFDGLVTVKKLIACRTK